MITFDWDNHKAILNERKHGVSFKEAMTVFSDPLELSIPDPDHSQGEARWLSMGRSSAGNLLVVAYTERDPAIIRIISARPATNHERKQYEQF